VLTLGSSASSTSPSLLSFLNISKISATSSLGSPSLVTTEFSAFVGGGAAAADSASITNP